MKRRISLIAGLFLILISWLNFRHGNDVSKGDARSTEGTPRATANAGPPLTEDASTPSGNPRNPERPDAIPAATPEASATRSTNSVTSPGTPFAGLGISDPFDSEWSNASPIAPGWHERARIVRTQFKSGLLRIEERVKFEWRDGKLAEVESRILRAADARHLLVSESHEDALDLLGIRSGGKPDGRYLVVPVPDPKNVRSIPELAEKLEKALPGVVFEPDALIRSSAQAGDPIISQGLAWHLENLGLLPGHQPGADIGATRAWDVRTDASPVIVAMIDSGISPGIPDLNGSLHQFPGETLGDGIDNDGNGHIDDVRGYDFHDNDAHPDDENGHGTMCAALIGATGNNGLGSTGVAWKASILNCRFMDRSGFGLLSDAIDAIDYARTSGAKILNLSWSYAGDAPLLFEALAQCDQEGILMICASGNSSYTEEVPAPANIPLPHVIAVAASTPADAIAEFSIVDPQIVDLAAPGVDLPVDTGAQPWNPFGEVRYATGTSFSAALVSGGLALGLAEFSTESPLDVVRRMMEAVKRLPGGPAALASGGRLDLGAMLAVAHPGVPHDLFADRAVLSDQAGRWTGRNHGAGIEPVDANLGLATPPARSLWFEWSASSTGLLRIHLSQSPGNPRVFVFSAANDLPGALLGGSSGEQVLELAVTAGQRLFWMIDSSTPIPGGLAIEWQLPPPNDNWADAEVLTEMTLDISGNSLGATVESFEAIQPYQAVFPEGSVWWKWTPPATGTVHFTVSPGHVLLLLPIGPNNQPVFPVGMFDLSAEELVSEVQVTAGQTLAVMAIPITRASAGPFRWSATTTAGITVFYEPQDVSTLEGETVVLEVIASSAGQLEYQWLKNGEEIPFARSHELRLSPVSRESFGIYQVRISNRLTEVMSAEADVSPRHEAPRLMALTPRKTVIVGQSVALSAAFRSTGGMTYTWSKNGTPLAGQTGSQFNITSAVLTDAGTYVLRATNASGTTSASFQLDVVETPWKGWLNRTPAMNGTGRILQVQFSGMSAGALTPAEWLASSDGGQSWTSVSLPPNFQSESGASQPDGTLLISGFAFETMSFYGPGKPQLWRRSPAGIWQLQQPVLNLPGSEAQPLGATISDLTYFDSEWWGRVSMERATYMIHSADGVQWTALADPENPSAALGVINSSRYEDRLAISYLTASWGTRLMYRLPGGLTKTMHLSDIYYEGVLKIGSSSYHFDGNKLLRQTDQETSSTVISNNGNRGLCRRRFKTGFLAGTKPDSLLEAESA